MAGEIQLNSTTMATESSGSITAELDTIRPNTTNGSLTLQGDSSDAGVTGLTIDSSGVVNTTTAKVTNIQATSGQSLTIKDEDGNTAITIGTDSTAAGYLSLNFGSYHGDSGGAGSGTLTGNTLSDYEVGTSTPSFTNLTIGNGSLFGTYIKIGRSVTVIFGFKCGSTTSVGTLGDITGLPFTASNDYTGYIKVHGVVFDSGARWHEAVAVIENNSSSVLIPSTPNYNSAISVNNPMTWSTNDTLVFTATYTTT